MKKVPTSQISNYKGQKTARDVFFHGFNLVPRGTIIDDTLLEKLEGIKQIVPYLFLDMEEEAVVVSPYAEELVSQLQQRVKLVMNNYSFEGMEDIETVSSIMDSIVSGLLSNQSFAELNLDTFFNHQPDLCSHSLNTAIISALLAIKSSRFQRWVIEQITLGALLHDIGAAKMLEDTNVTWEEIDYVKRQDHAEIGYSLLKENEFLPDAVKKIVLMHHVWEHPEESFDIDKKTYLSFPQKHKDKIINPSTKGLPVSIVQVADAFETFTNLSGPYKMTKKEAIYSIVANAEKIYGEGAILLGTYISPYGVGDEVTLNNGQKVIVIKQTSSTLRPVVKYLNKPSKIVDLRKSPYLKIEDN